MSSKPKSMTKNNTKKMLTRIHINLQIQVAIIAILYKKKTFFQTFKNRRHSKKVLDRQVSTATVRTFYYAINEIHMYMVGESHAPNKQSKETHTHIHTYTNRLTARLTGA